MLHEFMGGLTLGAIIAVASFGFSINYRILKFFNTAHGDMLTAGAFIAYTFNVYFSLDIISSIAIAGLLTGLLAVVLDRIFFSKQRGNKGSLFLLSLGVGLLLRYTIQAIFGTGIFIYKVPPFRGGFLGISALDASTYATFIVAVACIYLVMKGTRLGKAMRALSDDLELARVSGINVERVIMATWFMGGVLTGVAGGMLGLQTYVTVWVGNSFLLGIFAASLLGGDHLYGSLVGGFVIGLSEEIGGIFLKSTYKPAIGFAILILIISIRGRSSLRRGLLKFFIRGRSSLRRRLLK